MFLRSLVFASMLGTAAHAQAVPLFSEELGFDVKGVMNSETIVVENGGLSFVCSVSRKQPTGYYALKECLPLIGAKQARVVERAALASEKLEGEFLVSIKKLPPWMFAPLVSKTFADLGCKVDVDVDQEVFEVKFAQNVAQQFGFEGLISPRLIDEVGDFAEDAIEAMMEDGRVVVDRSAGTASLKACK